MKTIKWIFAAVLLCIAASGSAWADHGHGHSRVHFGVVIGPVWDPFYYRPYRYPYYDPYYSPYYPPVVVVQPQNPPVYVEQGDSTPGVSSATNYWYYCAASRSYYPYVKECSGGWQKVAPQPPQ